MDINTNPEEFKKFHLLLTLERPDFAPFYHKLAKESKDPHGGYSWKNEGFLTFDEAYEWMKEGGNVAIAARADDPLVIVDIDNIEAVGEFKPTLTCMSSKRYGKHAFYFTDDEPLRKVEYNGHQADDVFHDTAKMNIAVDEVGEIRSKWEYVVCAGSYVYPVPEKLKNVPENEMENAGKYTIVEARPPNTITYNELPSIYKEVHEADKTAAKIAEEQRKAREKQKEDRANSEVQTSAMWSLDLFDVTGLRDEPGRIPSIFHDSTTGKNIAVKDGLLHCFRCLTTHNGITALAVMSGVAKCRDGYRHGTHGRCSIDFTDGEIVYKMWKYAKDKKIIPENDPIPRNALVYYAVSNGYCKYGDIKDGWKIPFGVYNKVIENAEINFGREQLTIDTEDEQSSDESNTWNNMIVPTGYSLNGCLNQIVYNKNIDDKIEVPFCQSPAIVTSVGANIDDGGYWLEVTFNDVFDQELKEWISQKDALSRRGIMELATRGLNLIEKNSSTMNEYISQCIKTNRSRLPKRIVTEKNGWKNENTLFAFGCHAFSKDEIYDIIPLRKEASQGLKECGEIEEWIKAVQPIMHLPMIRLKMYAVMAAPLLRILGIQSFILDHNGESSIGKTFSNNLAMSMIGNADILRFNGDTTKTAAEILAEMYTDLPLYLDETGTQQSEEVLKAIVYMLSNEQGRMRGHKDGGLRETGTWKTIALTTGERPLTSHKSFSGQQVRVVEVRGGLTKDVIEDVKTAADTIQKNYGFFAYPYFIKLFEYLPQITEMYKMSRQRYITVDNVKTNRIADSFAAMLVAGMLLEDVFYDHGIETTEPHKIIDEFFTTCIDTNKIESYSIRALHCVIDWTQSKNMCFYDEDNPSDRQSHEFFGWISQDYIDVIPNELRKCLDRNQFDSGRVFNDWFDDGLLVTNKGRRDYNATHNGKQSKVVRLKRKEVYNVLFN